MVAIAGMASTAFQAGWGKTLLHATPQSIARYARLTYAIDLLIFLGALINVVACGLMLAGRRRRAG